MSTLFIERELEGREELLPNPEWDRLPGKPDEPYRDPQVCGYA